MCKKKINYTVHHSGLMATNTPSAARPSPTNPLHSLTYRINDSTFLSTTPLKGADRFPGSSSVLKAANRYRWSCTTHIALLICSSNSSTSLSKLLSAPPTPGIGKDASFHRAVPARFRIFPMAVIWSTMERLYKMMRMQPTVSVRERSFSA